MKKKFSSILLFFSIICSNIYAINDDDKIIYAMLMNQIQFSLQTIEHYKSRLVLDQEYENIICKIDKTKLNDKEQESITAYSNMLTTLTNLKLQDNEKVFIKQQAEKEKSEAINKSLSNVGSGVGVAITAFSKGNPISVVSGLVLTGVSTVFSYKDALNNAENQKIRDLFKLEQQTLKTVEMQKNALWTTYSKFITTYNIPKEYEIKQDQMLWLVETLDNSDARAKINLLEQKRSIFRLFSPYWFELGRAYQIIGNNTKAKECYAIFEQQKTKYSIIDNDTYYTELAKNMILIARAEKDEKSIRKYLNIIAQDKTAVNESENRFYMAGVYFTLGDNKEALRLLKLVIDDNRQYVMQARNLYEYIDAVSTDDENYKKAMLLGQLKMATKEEIQEVLLSVKGRTNIITKAKKLFLGTEIDSLNDDMVVMFLPYNYGQEYSLSLFVNEKYYDSISLNYNNRQYYFIDMSLKKFIQKFNQYSIILNGSDGDEFTLDYSSTFFDSGNIKSLNKAFSLINDYDKSNTIKMDLTNVEYFDVKRFLDDFEQLEKDKEFKKDENQNKLKIITDKYTLACKNNLTTPYLYKKNTLSKDNDFLYIYGLVSFSDKTDQYFVSKYGDLSKIRKGQIFYNRSLQDKYKNALLGESESQYSLGMAYLNGEGIDINYFEAIKWFKLSAIKGNMNAYYQLGICFENGYGVEKNKERARYYYQQAAELGHKKAKELIK